MLKEQFDFLPLVMSVSVMVYPKKVEMKPTGLVGSCKDSVCWSTTLTEVQTEISQQVQDGLQWNLVQIHHPQRMNPNDFNDPVYFPETPP